MIPHSLRGSLSENPTQILQAASEGRRQKEKESEIDKKKKKDSINQASERTQHSFML